MPLKIYAKLSHHFSQREPWPPILCERFWLPAEEVVISHVSEFVCDRQQLIAESYERASIKSGGLITPDPTRDWWFRSGISAVKWLLIFFAVTTVQPAETEDCLQIYTLFMWKSKVTETASVGGKAKLEDMKLLLKFIDFYHNIITASDWLVCSLFAVHGRSDIRRGESHVHSLPEPKEAEDRHLSQGQRRRVSRKPTSSLGTGHRHPESSAAGRHSLYIETC